MPTSLAARRSLIHLGMDVHKDSISVGILHPDEESPVVERISADEVAVRRFIARFPRAKTLTACYEAGPTGYELHRLLTSMGVSCRVVAPSLIPKAPGDKVKTDKRDCRRLARLDRAGELVAIRVPSREEESVRDLCRARADMVDDLSRAHKRLGAFLLRHGKVYRDGVAWTLRHRRWLGGLEFSEAGLEATFSHYRVVAEAREAELEAMEATLAPYFSHPRFADQVARLSAYRGVARMGALSLASEVCDWRRFGTAAGFMGFTGLVASEYSSGASTSRGHLTKAGNSHLRTQLIESAWAYQHRPAVGLTLRHRQEGLDPDTLARSWAAQCRLCGRFSHLGARKNVRSVVAAAIARELAGFLWAEMTA